VSVAMHLDEPDDADLLAEADALARSIWARVNPGTTPPTLRCPPCPLVSEVPAEDARETTWWRAMSRFESQIPTVIPQPAALPVVSEVES